MKPVRVALATRNPGKAREIRAILEGAPVEIVLPDASWRSPPEDAPDYEGNAVAKAHSLAAHMRLAALADDSGIEVDALGGEPGPRSARLAGEGAGDEANLRALLDALAPIPEGARSARYRCVAALATTDGGVTTAEGIVEGILRRAPRGTGGFGYDPIFVPEGESRTMAELPQHEKDRISHRGRAFRALLPALEALAREAGASG